MRTALFTSLPCEFLLRFKISQAVIFIPGGGASEYERILYLRDPLWGSGGVFGSHAVGC